jgi:pheromone shutdown protein TraB
MQPADWRALADAVLLLHGAVVLFVVGGLLLIVVGNLRGWSWVNGAWLRLAHLAAILVVVAEAWFGVVCPLTALEQAARVRAGDAGYGGGFVEHWVQRLIYYDLPGWVFVLGYSLFALAVLAAWWRWPPGRR